MKHQKQKMPNFWTFHPEREKTKLTQKNLKDITA